MTAVGFTTAQTSDCRVHGVVAKEKVKLLLVVSANSRDSVERIRQTPSDESVSRSFAEAVGLMIGVVNGISRYRGQSDRAQCEMASHPSHRSRVARAVL